MRAERFATAVTIVVGLVFVGWLVMASRPPNVSPDLVNAVREMQRFW